MENGRNKCAVSHVASRLVFLFLGIRFGLGEWIACGIFNGLLSKKISFPETCIAQQCISADNVPGTCVNLATCLPIVQMAQNTQISMVDTFYSYLSQSLCGFDGNDLLVSGKTETRTRHSINFLLGGTARLTSQVCCSPTAATFAPQAPNTVQADIFTFLPIVASQPVTAALPTPAIVTTSLPPPAPTPPPSPPPPPPTQPNAQLVRLDDVCGISNFTSTRVVGGSNAKLSKYTFSPPPYHSSWPFASILQINIPGSLRSPIAWPATRSNSCAPDRWSRSAMF